MVKMLSLLVSALILFSYCPVNGSRPTLKTNLGIVEGLYKHSYNAREFAAFEGIPYAKPPIDELRFREPISAEPWVGILNATTTYTCMQNNMFVPGDMLIGDEDCLYLNVYVPKTVINSNNKFDVLVHIHGGAFMVGDPKSFTGPSYLMDKDIVYINMNYRLGVLGFLSTEDNVVPGNMGMKDQSMALKWIKENVEYFGGNPNSVTITGVSAGGASVHLHYFSELSKGLFHRGFSQSGTAFGPWVLQEGALQRARRLAALVGCDFPSTETFVNCMRHRSAKQLIEFAAAHLTTSIPMTPLAIFSPIIEPKSDHAFLVDQPYNLLKTKNFNDVPWITAMVAKEGVLGTFLYSKMYDQIEENWNDVAQYVLDYNETVCNHHKSKVAEQIKSHYFGSKTISNETQDSLVKLFGDRLFSNSLEESARLQAMQSKSPVFAYIYDYKASGREILGKLFGIEGDFDVTHGEDALMIYDWTFPNMPTIKMSVDDIKMKDMFLNMLTLFANNQVPKIGYENWHPVGNSDDFSYLSVSGPNDIKMVKVKELTPRAFWNTLPIMENQKSGHHCSDHHEKNEL